ncbi:MAG: aminotransferase class V-fold PLP-dependent enzyme, partial [Clostridia bacterium]|nr:aminotransferase class V-fold PLP-dependent enzyme [Clostridia bacterium]
ISFDRIPSDADGIADITKLPTMFKGNTKLVIVSHASNVGGGLQDIEAIGKICEEKGVPFVVDGAQSAGHYPIDFKAVKLSALTVPAHKGLLGPQGIGALLIAPEFAAKVDPLITGGTGSASDSEIQPDYMPDRFESGTSNMPGIYGFEASTRFIEETGIDAIRSHEIGLTKRFLAGLDEIPGLRIVGPKDLDKRVGVVSVDCLEEDNAEVSYTLETQYGIMTRCGLHCAPSAHKTLGTFPQGVIRFSLSWFNTEEDVDAAVNALKEILE